MENFCRDYLLAVATAYGKAEKLALSTVSRRFHGADHFLGAFERGEVTITLRKFDEMLASFSAAWPKGVKWPKAAAIRLNKNSH